MPFFYYGVFFFFFFPSFGLFVFLGAHPWHMEVPRLGVELELKLPSYTATIAMQDLSHVCNLQPRLMAMPDR